MTISSIIKYLVYTYIIAIVKLAPFHTAPCPLNVNRTIRAIFQKQIMLFFTYQNLLPSFYIDIETLGSFICFLVYFLVPYFSKSGTNKHYTHFIIHIHILKVLFTQNHNQIYKSANDNFLIPHIVF